MKEKKKAIILLVEDDEITRYAIVQILSKVGFLTVEAGSGKEALKKIKSFPDLVILDINLPDTDGFSICKKIKQDPETVNIPVLFLSQTYKDSQSIAKGMEKGGDGYLTHPVEPEVLIAYVNSLLRMKKSKMEFIEAAKEWNVTFDAMTTGILILNQDGTVKRINRTASEIFSIPKENVIGKPINNIIKRWANSLDSESLEKLCDLQSRKTFSFSRAEQSYKKTIIPILDDKDNFVSLIMLIEDETEVKKLEEQYKQAQKMEAIGRLTGGIAHDFNNMLTVIIGYSNFLLSTLEDNDSVKPIMEEIKKAGEKAASLTQKLLAFSRKQTIKPEVIDLNSVVSDMEKILKRVIGEDISFNLKLAKKLNTIMFDKTQLEQIIMNIVVNARDAMPDGGTLTIETANVNLDNDYLDKHSDTKIKQGNYVLLAISDTGIGMDEKILQHIFEPFFTTKGKRQGTGLGLSTVYGIVKQNKGYIWVYSESGKGTTFKIYIPQLEKEQSGTKIKEAKEVNPVGNERILLIEDDKLILKMIDKGLSELGYRIESVNNPIDAIDIVKSNELKIDLLITDVIMPAMNGKKLAEKLKELYPELKVLFISGYTDSFIVKEGILQKGVEYLQKPFTPIDLAKKIRIILDK